MGMTRRLRKITAVCALAWLGLATAQAEESDADRAARWKQLQQAIFGSREVQDGSGLLRIEAPLRALDAAIVPVGLVMTSNQPIKGVYLVIDDNPAPLAGHFVFGPKADPRSIKVRVRVEQYTSLHAIAETPDGKLYAVAKFLKAAGGCSAPAGDDDTQALQDLGRMKLRVLGAASPGEPALAQLMIRHPNFNGMQMNQVTRFYTPARFIKTIDVTFQDGEVLHVDADISLSTDPVITFGLMPHKKGQLKVVARDTAGATFDQSFDVPGS
jgi:sulfur-oxidizing protein SoxY